MRGRHAPSLELPDVREVVVLAGRTLLRFRDEDGPASFALVEVGTVVSRGVVLVSVGSRRPHQTLDPVGDCGEQLLQRGWMHTGDTKSLSPFRRSDTSEFPTIRDGRGSDSRRTTTVPG